MIKKVFPVLALSTFVSMLGIGIITPLLPLYAESMGATGVWIGVIFSAFAASRIIIMPIIGRLSDRRGRKPFILIGLLAYAIISLGYIWAESVALLSLVRLVHGAASAMILPIAMAYIGDLAPEGEEGRWMGYANAAFFSGFGFGPLMGGILTDNFGMDVAFIAMGGLNLLAFLLAIFLLPEIRQRKMGTSLNPSFREMGTSGMLKGLFSSRLAAFLGMASFQCFLPIFAATYIGLSPTLIGTLLGVNILLMSVLGIPGGRIADRVSKRVMVVTGSLITVIFLALIPFTHSFWQLLGLCCLHSIGGAISMPASSALTVGEGRKFGMGSTMAVVMMAMSIGMVIGPVVGGAIVDLTNLNTVFYFGAGIVVVGACLFIWFTRRGTDS